MQKEIELENLKKIVKILIEYNPSKEIKIDMENIELKLTIDSSIIASEYLVEGYYKKDALSKKTCVEYTYEGNKNVLSLNRKMHNMGYWICCPIEDSDYTYEDTIFASSSSVASINDRFFFLTLSEALEDDDNIYIVKNKTNLGGKGAIERLNHGTKDRSVKIRRRELLASRFGKPIIGYNQKEWYCIDIINKKNLDNEEYFREVFYSFIYNYLLFGFTVEDIICSVY